MKKLFLTSLVVLALASCRSTYRSTVLKESLRDLARRELKVEVEVAEAGRTLGLRFAAPDLAGELGSGNQELDRKINGLFTVLARVALSSDIQPQFIVLDVIDERRPQFHIVFTRDVEDLRRAMAEAISFKVQITNSASVPATATAQIQAALNAAFLGQDGGLRARIGSTIYASRFYAAVTLLGPWAQVILITIGNNASPAWSLATCSISGTTLTTSASTGVAIGQFVYGASVQPGTRITAGTGTSWTVSVSQTAGSETMTGVAPTLNDTTMQIDQIPTLNPADAWVVLV